VFHTSRPSIDEALRQLGRAGLAAEDQQADLVERVGRPERGQRRHRRDDSDALGDQPRAEVHPLRTRLRGAGTRQAPYRQASHISSQDASNATDRPAITRSPGPIGSSARNSACLGVHERGGVCGA
jgi:hypothetical protein